MLYLFLSFFFALEKSVNNSRECRAYKRTYDEYPKLAEGSGVAVDSRYNRGAEASCGVNRCACKADAENVNQCKCKTDYKTAEGTVLSLL